MTEILKLKPPYAIFLGDVDSEWAAKTGHGIVQWRPELCAGQVRLPGCKVDLGISEISEDSLGNTAKTLIIGVAGRGGLIPEHWMDTMCRAASQGLDIVAGGHVKLRDNPELVQASEKSASKLIDVRIPPRNIPVGTGRKRTGKRLITVGTDCVVGKKYTALSIDRELKARGIETDFRATGQTGIMIAGSGIPIDAVVCDFTAGAAEILSPDNNDNHWDIIEGQGSLFNPSYAGVSLGLLHGSQPDSIVVCHELGRKHINGLPDYPMPSIAETIEKNLSLARLTNPHVKCIGISVNSSALSSSDSKSAMQNIEQETGLPCVDPIRSNVGPIIEKMMEI